MPPAPTQGSQEDSSAGCGDAPGRRWTGPAEPLLRPALELAVAVARAGERGTPTVPPPRPLRPLLSFARLPAPALEAVRRVLDEDDAFRARVSESAEEADLGRPAWLFLTRPAGWEDELAAHAVSAEQAAAVAADEQAERSASRRLKGAEETARRAEGERDSARAELGTAHQELAAERRIRRAAEDEAARLASLVRVAEAQREQSRGQAEEAAAEAARTRIELVRLEAEVAGATARMGARERGPAPVPPGQGALDAAAGAREPEMSRALLEEVARAVREASEGASLLAAALAAAAGALLPPALTDADRRPGTDPGGPGASSGGGVGLSSAPPLGSGRRLPVPLPPAIFEDAPEAAHFLVRTPRVVLLVDGYNASLSTWPGLSIARQRERLVDALSELSARTGSAVHVVFDGAEGEARSRSPAAPTGVRVSFSPGDVEADDVILALVDQAAPGRPVVVASDDRRVQREAGRRGANVITISQLLAVLRRER